MSTLAADVVTFDFSFPPCDPTTPPSFTFDPSLLEIPSFHHQPTGHHGHGHARSSSHGSVYSFESSPSDSSSVPVTASTSSTRRTTPARSPIRTHGPLLLPKIRSQDQAFMASEVVAPAPKRARTAPVQARAVSKKAQTFRPSHQRSYTNPEVPVIPYSAALTFGAAAAEAAVVDANGMFMFGTPEPTSAFDQSRRASSCSLDSVSLEKYGYPTYRQMPTYVPAARTSLSPSPTPQPPQQSSQSASHLSPADSFATGYQSYTPRASSPLASAAPITPNPPVVVDLTQSTTLFSYLTSPNPAPSLVHSISFPLRDPHTKHFWWDVRQIRPWTSFSAASILSLPGASACLSVPLSSSLLPNPVVSQRHPETESALHAIYASHYLPKINNALMLCSQRPLQLSVPAKNPTAAVTGEKGLNTECMYVANLAGESSTAATIFGGKPSARVVGLVKSFDRFNTGMRVEGNVKRVEYLRGLAHLHHAMREHGCRYGFILTEIELVFVRNGAETTPHFGYLEVGSVQLAASSPEGDSLAGVPQDVEEVKLTACLALWGLCMLASDDLANNGGSGQAHWKSEIGAPAEGTRRKAMPRDDWMPQPQLAEKREAKRSRGWVWPEDAIGRKELGKRGVRYGGC